MDLAAAGFDPQHTSSCAGFTDPNGRLTVCEMGQVMPRKAHRVASCEFWPGWTPVQHKIMILLLHWGTKVEGGV